MLTPPNNYELKIVLLIFKKYINIQITYLKYNYKYLFEIINYLVIAK